MDTEEKGSKISTWIAFALLPLSGFATDIYLPSMPNMAAQLKVSELDIQSTLTVFLISYGLTQLFVGSLLDSFGRYRIGLVSMVLFSATCFVIAMSHSLEIIYLMRIIQGMTAATIIVAKRAYFVDVYKGEKLKHLLSLFTIIWSLGPITAPFIGGYLETIFGWESNFILLGVLVMVCTVLDFIYSSETLNKAIKFNFSTITKAYVSMLTAKSFLLGIILLSFTYTIVMLYNMMGPFIIENVFNKNSIVSGYCSLALGFAWMLGGLISKKTLGLHFHKKINMNIALQLLFVILMFWAASLFSTLMVMMLFAFVVQVCTGYTYNNYFIFCLSRFPDFAAMSGGLTGGIVYIIVSILSYGMIRILPPDSMVNLSMGYVILTACSVGVVVYLYRISLKLTK